MCEGLMVDGCVVIWDDFVGYKCRVCCFWFGGDGDVIIWCYGDVGWCIVYCFDCYVYGFGGCCCIIIGFFSVCCGYLEINGVIIVCRWCDL